MLSNSVNKLNMNYENAHNDIPWFRKYQEQRKSLPNNKVFDTPMYKKITERIENFEAYEESQNSIKVFSNGDDNSTHVIYSRKKHPFHHVISANCSPTMCESSRPNSIMKLKPSKLEEDFSKWVQQNEPRIPGKIWNRKTQTYLNLKDRADEIKKKALQKIKTDQRINSRRSASLEMILENGKINSRPNRYNSNLSLSPRPDVFELKEIDLDKKMMKVIKERTRAALRQTIRGK